MKRFLAGACLATIIFVCAFRAGADTFYVTELFSSDVFKVDSAGDKTVFATIPGNARGVAVDSAGNVFVADYIQDVIYKYTPSGSRSVFDQSVPDAPLGMTFDSSGNLFVGTQAGTIYKYDPAGNRTLFANNSQTSQVTNLAFATSGDLYAAYPDANAIHRFTTSGDGTFVASNKAVGLAFDSIGNLFVTDNGNGIITEYNPAGAGTVFANSGLFSPWSLTFDSQGKLYVANAGANDILAYDSAGTGTVFASGFTGNPAFIADVAAVPEPSTVAVSLLLSCVIALQVVRRCAAQRRASKSVLSRWG